MQRISLIVAAALWQFVGATTLLGQSPDKIPNSLIPPLKVNAQPATAAESSNAATPIDPAASAAPEGYEDEPPAADDYAIRLAIWNSPEMIDARKFVLDYSARSAQSSRKEGERFLARLSRLSSAEMRTWLERLQAARAQIARQRDVTEAARQMQSQQAAQRVEEARQAAANFNQWQSLSAQFLQQRMQSQQTLAQQRQSFREISRSNAIAGQRIYYDPFAPTLDPASPSRRVRAFAAAILPGDLPRSDPRNFIRDNSAASDAAERGEGPPAAAAATSAPDPANAPPSGE